MSATPNATAIHLRSAFISDVHLGTKGCRADLLQEFLETVEVETLVLIGDIVDLRSMSRSFFWPQEHINVLRAILGKAKRGTRVIYIPGNHDDVFRELAGSVFGNLEIHREYVHETADGRRLLVVHGRFAHRDRGSAGTDRDDCRRYALEFTLERGTRQFLTNLAPRAQEMTG